MTSGTAHGLSIPFITLVPNCIWDPHIRVRGCRRGSAMVPFKRGMVISFGLFLVTTVLSLNHSAAICHRMTPMLKSTGGGHYLSTAVICKFWHPGTLKLRAERSARKLKFTIDGLTRSGNSRHQRVKRTKKGCPCHTQVLGSKVKVAMSTSVSPRAVTVTQTTSPPTVTLVSWTTDGSHYDDTTRRRPIQQVFDILQSVRCRPHSFSPVAASLALAVHSSIEKVKTLGAKCRRQMLQEVAANATRHTQGAPKTPEPSWRFPRSQLIHFHSFKF